MKAISLLFFFWSIASILTAQQGKVFDNLSMKSEILKMDRKYAIYLPPDYETSRRSYPVLYLLHGGGGNHLEWVQHGEVMSITDKAIKEASATPMIIVMPDGRGPHRGYSNDAKGEWLYEDFFFQEFMPYIEKTYRIRPEKRYRAISGLSMGGNGTFTYALHHPELFSAACPLSAGSLLRTFEEAKEKETRNDPNIPDSLIVKFYNRQSVFELIKKMPEDQKNAVRWYIDCGDDDSVGENYSVYEGNCLIHVAMRKKEIPHEFRIRDGAHTWNYWRSALPSVLEFVTESFHN